MPRYGIPDLDARVAYLESLMEAQKQVEAEEQQQSQPQAENQEEATVFNPQVQMQQFSMFQIPENLIHPNVQESPVEEEVTTESVVEIQEEEQGEKSPKEEEVTTESVVEAREEEQEEKSQKRVSRRRKKTDAESEQPETTTTVPPAAFDFPVSETTNTTPEPVAPDTTFESAENE